MQENERDPPDVALGERSAQSTQSRVSDDACADEDVVSDLLQEWEDRYLRNEDPSPGSLVMNDPVLHQALEKRIAEHKRVLEVLWPAGDAVRESDQGAVQIEPEACEPRANAGLRGSDPDGRAPTIPSRIGRYEITRVLGQGGFGLVYQGYDADLDRAVAIKVPNAGRPAALANIDAFLSEARILARLSHPNIVPVYDVGRFGDGGCFVVSKYIEGGDLKERLKRGRYSVTAAAQLVAELADALHYAHTQDLFHRDIKPANILIDAGGVPCLADFGLALRDEDVGKGAHIVGTANYMSPEQAGGEGHLVDGRSDIYSLAIVFYELLTGRLPFRGRSRDEIMQKIIASEPRPPRQIDDAIPAELERICLKALARRASERYSTARDLAADLQHFLNTSGAGGAAALPSRGASAHNFAAPREAAVPDSTELPKERSDSSGHAIKIVPKGLCSFDEHDFDFFLELLPGPRDRAGLPEGLRFWKTRIEETDPDKSFRVGVIYGPSGCGKSSLVKAGLLPLLSRQVIPIYVEASETATEARLLRSVWRAFPELPNDGGLVESLASIRRGHGLASAAKALLVIDQFEQWLFSHSELKRQELVVALRQCDGARLQALCLVRDDFWMATTRFMRDLEIDLVPHRNIAAVDLFEPKHARKVLAAYGRAYEALPSSGAKLSREQTTFLDQAAGGLAQDGKIVPVRLALFADMIKSKPWTPATLRAVGGMEGVGVKFLEETFDSPRASLKHRYHQKAAQAVLKSLLPDSNADIKGRMRSTEELLAASGYAAASQDFDDLIRILDTDLRLITPVDLETASDDDARATGATPARSYQLTHDYLVHSLRNWLTQKQRESRRGRAELLLAERAALWVTKPQNRHLPSPLEWLKIRSATRRKDWTTNERRMMGRARTVHGLRLSGLLVLVALIGCAVTAFNVFTQTGHLLALLPRTKAEKLPEVLGQLEKYPRWIYSSRLRELAARQGGDPHSRLALSLALLPEDSGQVDDLLERLPAADLAEMVVIRDRLIAAAPLAHNASNRSGALVEMLLGADARAFSILFPLIEANRLAVLPDLRKAASLRHADLSPDSLRPVARSSEWDREHVTSRQTAADEGSFRIARASVALARLGHGTEVWPLLRYTRDPRWRSAFLIGLSTLGADPGLLASELRRLMTSVERAPKDAVAPADRNAQLFDETTSTKRALVLALAEYPRDAVNPSERDAIAATLLDLYRSDADAGIHSAAELALRRWGYDGQLKIELDSPLRAPDLASRCWYINREGQSLVLIDGPVTFDMGSPPTDPDQQNEEVIRRSRIPRRFFMLSKEVTIEEFQRFAKAKWKSPRPNDTRYSPYADGPQIHVNWFLAAEYCNWLSEREHLPQCYKLYKEGELAEVMVVDAGAIAKGGYRLPTEAEWEYACRAGTITSRYFGHAVELLKSFGATSQSHASRCGQLLPNDFGLFDMMGNVLEWCHDLHPKSDRPQGAAAVHDDVIAGETVAPDLPRYLRGAGWRSEHVSMRSAARTWFQPSATNAQIGLRPARTCP